MSILRGAPAPQFSAAGRLHRSRRLGAAALGAILIAGLVGAPVQLAFAEAPAAPEPAGGASLAIAPAEMTGEPSGREWRVPNGVTEVYVGLTGGAGGTTYVPVSSAAAGRGARFVLAVPVTGGDVLTTYSGKNASGNGDQTIGGAGFVNGGRGGSKSLTAHPGGGGGGASALKLNGSIIAVAGGGGGVGGLARSAAGSAGEIQLCVETQTCLTNQIAVPSSGAGGGGGGGSAGQNAVSGAGFPGLGRPGGDGQNAGTGTHGGGGGAGGGGWPSSGTNGGSGHKFWGYHSGGGGGAGFSWHSSETRVILTDGSAGPGQRGSTLYATGTNAQITMPERFQLKVSAPAQVNAGEAFSVSVNATRPWASNYGINGPITLFRDGVELDFPNPWQQQMGYRKFSLAGLPAGTYRFEARFEPILSDTAYKPELAKASRQFTVVVDPPTDPPTDPVGPSDEFAEERASEPAVLAAAADESSGIESLAPTRTAVLLAPLTAGAFEPVTVKAASEMVTGGPAPVGQVSLLADGVSIAEAMSDGTGNMVFADVLIPWGTAELLVHYAGDTLAGTAGSSSEPFSINLQALPTTTSLTMGASTLLAGDSTPVRARVVNEDIDGVPGPDVLDDPRGEMQLVVDGEVVARAPAGLDVDADQYDGDAEFELDTAGIPAGTHDVIARFVPAGGFNPSETASMPIEIKLWNTVLDLGGDAMGVNAAAGAPVRIGFTAAAIAPAGLGGSSATPPDAAGFVQAFLDGTALGDPVEADGTGAALPLAGLAAGTHDIELQYTPFDERLGEASAQVTVTLSAGSAGGGGAGSGPSTGTTKPAASLSKTGSEPAAGWVSGALLVAAAGVLALGVARQRRARSREQ